MLPSQAQSHAAQPTEAKRHNLVLLKKPATTHKRKRVRNLMPELLRRIPALFDLTGGDYDRVAEDLGVPRSDVLAVVLADTRRKMPGPAGAARLALGRIA